MKLSPEPIQAYLSRGLFLGAIVAVCFLVVSPPPATIAPIAMFVLCEVISIILGLKFWPVRPAKVGALGSIILGLVVIGLSVTSATILFNKREVLKERVLRLEGTLQDLGRSMDK